MSSAIRLGITGPLHAQRMQHQLAVELELLAQTAPPAIEEAAQTAPVLDMVQGTHDRLYSRLFVS